MDIKLTEIYKSYKDVPVLENINILFKKGKTTCIMGASGIGKTTLIRILTGLTKADRGKIQGVDGRKAAVVFQEDALIDHWDALKNVELVCDPSITKEMIEEEFFKLGLENYKNKAVSQLSGGMRRRVAILRALMADSDLIVMDEPFSALDEDSKIRVIEYIKMKTKGKTLVVVTHDKEDVQRMGGDVVLLT